MKATKRLLAVLMVLVLLCLGVPFAFAEGEEEYQVGDQIQFGTYPQTRVDETPELKAAAEAATWKSYGYYSGTGNWNDGLMVAGDYMSFADFFCNGEKYRAVVLSAYRPLYTGYISNAENSFQDNNGYTINNTYYFRYDPLLWRVLDPSIGFIVCDNIIDSQPFQSFVFEDYQDVDATLYSNNYSTSSIRDWLNNTFFETAFTDEQKALIQISELNNDSFKPNYSQYSSSITFDRVFLISYFDTIKSEFSFSNNPDDHNVKRIAQGTDYAKCQGLRVCDTAEYYNNSIWKLRTPSVYSYCTCYVKENGVVTGNDSKNVFCTYEGIRPACVVTIIKNDNSKSEFLFSADSNQHPSGKPVLENEVAATCTQKGSYDEVIYCTACGEELGRETITVDPLGHTPQTYTTPSTCAENGFTITICTRCGETLSKEILPRLDHNWTSEVTQNPTCTAQGVKTYTCESCGETYTEPVDVLAHEWDDGKMTKAPSCTEAGEMTYTCGIGGETRTEPIDKLDHEIVLVAGKAASCTEPGLTDGWQCKQCKKWFAEQQTIPALDHDPQIGKVVDPTCTEPGYTPFICTRCGETVRKTDPTDALGHNMQPTYVWAKDDSTVTATMVCTRCDKTGMTETAEVKTEVTVKPTCSTEGELTLIAAFNNKSFYGQTKTKTLPRDPNAHVFKVTVTPPTCIDEGYTTHACTLCRYGYSDEIVPALGHKPVTDEAVPATCEAPGLTEGSHCSVCGEVLTAQEETPVIDHADADNDGLCDTCEQQMTGGDHCKYCGKVHGGAFGWLISFFHSILAIFKR